MKKTMIFCAIFLLVINIGYSQVEGPNRIKGSYSGDQKKELANGDGKAVGTDIYEGNFKKGYPDGKGIYTFGEDMEIEGYLFKNGDIYEGEFSKGKFEGYGKLTCKSEGKVIVGYWSNNKYMGKTKDGYEVLLKKNIMRVECRYDGSGRNDIEIVGLDYIVEASHPNIEFDGQSKYTGLPGDKFPMILHIKGTVPSSGAKAELKIWIEKPGTWTIIISSDSI